MDLDQKLIANGSWSKIDLQKFMVEKLILTNLSIFDIIFFNYVLIFQLILVLTVFILSSIDQFFSIFWFFQRLSERIHWTDFVIIDLKIDFLGLIQIQIDFLGPI